MIALSPVTKLLLAYGVSASGSTMYRLAVPLAIYQNTQSAFLMSVAYASSVIPIILFSLFGGVAADRGNLKKILVVGDILSALIAIVLCISLYWHLNVFVVISLVFLLGCVNAVYAPSFFAAVPAITAKEAIPRTNAIMRVIDGVFQTLGPVMGGLIVAFSSPEAVFLFDATTFLVSTVIILSIKEQRLSASERTVERKSIISDIKDGLLLIWNTPFLRLGLRLFIITNFSFHMFFGSIVFYLSSTLQLSSSYTGIIIATGGAGAAVAAYHSPKLSKFATPGRIISISTIVAGVAMLAFALTDETILIALSLAVILSSGAINTVVFISFTQQIVSSAYIGRVGATNRLVGISLVPIGAMAGGAATAMFGFVEVAMVCAALRMLIGLVSILTPSFVMPTTASQLPRTEDRGTCRRRQNGEQH